MSNTEQNLDERLDEILGHYKFDGRTADDTKQAILQLITEARLDELNKLPYEEVTDESNYGEKVKLVYAVDIEPRIEELRKEIK